MLEQLAALDKNPQLYAQALEKANGLIGSDPRIQELARVGDVRFHALYEASTIKDEDAEARRWIYPLTGECLVVIILQDRHRDWVLETLVELGMTSKEAFVDYFGYLTEKYFKEGQKVKSMYDSGPSALVVSLQRKVKAGDKYGDCEILEAEQRKELRIMCPVKKGQED
jgi:hypothetical protein